MTNIFALFNNKVFATDFEFNIYNYSKKINFINPKKLFIKSNSNKFDVIIMRHVLEHILDFETLLEKIKVILKKKTGILIIEVPNYNSVWLKILGNNWPGYFFPYHHYVFSENFLKEHLKNKGFRVVKAKKVEPPIFGAFFYSVGFNRNLSKIFSILLYPIQILISKITFKSEALLLFVKND